MPVAAQRMSAMRAVRSIAETLDSPGHAPPPLTRVQREKQDGYESLDYHPSMTDAFRRRLRDAPTGAAQRNVLRWALHVLIACAVGVTASLVTNSISVLEEWRVEATAAVVAAADERVAGLCAGLGVWVLSATLLVAASAAVVVFFEPAAGGSGIPEVIAYLNGVAIHKVLNVRTFAAKLVSCVAAVGAGLPVGAEAPLIHLGAIVGAGVSQGRSRTLSLTTDCFTLFRNNKDLRDFTTAGAACGVSAAFGAPIGGLLFVMEEVSSFWDLAETAQMFLGTMLCFTVVAFANSLIDASSMGRGFVSNKAAVMFEVEYAGSTPLNITAIVPALFLGLWSGLLAAAFTRLNLAVVSLRRALIKPYPMRRLAEPVLVILLFATLGYIVPFAVSCRPTVSPEQALQRAHLNTSDVTPWHTENGTRLAQYVCSEPGTYNPLSSLTTTGIGKGAIRRLMSRRTIDEFPLPVLVTFLVLYFLFAAYVSGAAVASGTVIPMLVIGAAHGRIFGYLLVKAFASRVAAGSGESLAAYWVQDSWMDPGVFALIGAGAFFGGVSRMTFSLSVIMAELSGELHYLLPIMVAIVASRAVADRLCAPLYHQLLDLDCIPYLPTDPGLPLEGFCARDAIRGGVVSLRRRESFGGVLEALLRTRHQCFPVLDDTGCAGVVKRGDLQVLLALPAFQELLACAARKDEPGTALAEAALAELSHPDWEQHCEALFFLSGSQEWHRRWDSSDTVESLSSPAYRDVEVDLGVVLNRSPWSVPAEFDLAMTFSLFRTMALRFVVVTSGTAVVGVLTRKDLLPSQLAVLHGGHRSVSDDDDDDDDDDEAGALVARRLGGGLWGWAKAQFLPVDQQQSALAELTSDSDA